MSRKLFITGALALTLIFSGCGVKGFFEGVLFEKTGRGVSSEKIFNRANGFMSKGDYAKAIKYYYVLAEERGDFSAYMDDVMYRLGLLLYKTERYSEAEKILRGFAEKYRNHKGLKNAYEMLLRVYVHELDDEKRAEKIRNLYEKRFGKSIKLKTIDRTIALLHKENTGKGGMLALEPKDINIDGSAVTHAFDREFFPVRNYILKKVKSPDNRYVVERKKVKKKYHLYLGDRKSRKVIRIKNSRNGYAPQWSWDSRRVAFTSMDWRSMERRVKVYYVKEKRTDVIFKGREIGPILSFSPDGSKLLFWYRGKPWVANMRGQVSLLSPEATADKLGMVAWSKSGGRIAVRAKGANKRYRIYTLAKREIQIIK